MTLLEEWRNAAYEEGFQESKEGQEFWRDYFLWEKGIYEQILKDPENVVEGTVEELAGKYEVDLNIMVGFLDGINDSLKNPNPIETMEKDTKVSLDVDLEKLYYNMVGCNAEWLYTLPAWEELLSEDVRKKLYKESKLSGTIRKEDRKVGRNDPCPCGSGKKYKHCCGRK